MPLTQTLSQLILTHQLIPAGTRVLVAVSGGADSLALLHCLHHLQPSLQYKLHVATLDHGIRGAESIADMRFVVQTAQAWGIPVSSEQADTPRYAQTHRLGLEAAARALRYDFLASQAYENQCTHIALAHHQDDQAETILMNIIRGSGISGLGGMALSAPLNNHPDLTLIRPLLFTARATIEAYCQAHELSPRHDSTNTDLIHRRNYIRQIIMPQLRDLNPQIAQALTQLGEIAQEEEAYLQQQIAPLLLHYTQDHATGRSINRQAFAAWPPTLQRRVLLQVARQLGSTEISYPHILNAIGIATQSETGTEIHLPGNLRLRVGYEALILEPIGSPAPPMSGPSLPPGTVMPLHIPGHFTLPSGDWTLHCQTPPPAHPAGLRPLSLPADCVAVLRTRQAGDRFAPVGLGGQHQRLKKWFIDHKIPQDQRDRIPILSINGRVAGLYVQSRWIFSQDFVKPSDDTGEQAVYFHFEPTERNTIY